MKKYDLVFLTEITEEYTKKQAVYFFNNGYGIIAISKYFGYKDLRKYIKKIL